MARKFSTWTNGVKDSIITPNGVPLPYVKEVRKIPERRKVPVTDINKHGCFRTHSLSEVSDFGDPRSINDHLFNIFADHMGIEIGQLRDEFEKYSIKYKKELSKLSEAFFSRSGITYKTWRAPVKDGHHRGDELAITILCMMLGIHACIDLIDGHWTTIVDVLTVHEVAYNFCDLHLIFVGRNCYLKWKPRPRGERPGPDVIPYIPRGLLKLQGLYSSPRARRKREPMPVPLDLSVKSQDDSLLLAQSMPIYDTTPCTDLHIMDNYEDTELPNVDLHILMHITPSASDHGCLELHVMDKYVNKEPPKIDGDIHTLMHIVSSSSDRGCADLHCFDSKQLICPKPTGKVVKADPSLRPQLISKPSAKRKPKRKLDSEAEIFSASSSSDEEEIKPRKQPKRACAWPQLKTVHKYATRGSVPKDSTDDFNMLASAVGITPTINPVKVKKERIIGSATIIRPVSSRLRSSAPVKTNPKPKPKSIKHGNKKPSASKASADSDNTDDDNKKNKGHSKGTFLYKTYGYRKVTRVRTHICVICQTSCSDIKTLNAHYKQSHQFKGICDICNNEFLTPITLTRHRYNHGALPFKCKTCKERFPFKSMLTTHMITHSNLKYHKCHYRKCDKEFKNKGDLMRHLNDHFRMVNLVCPFGDYETDKRHNYQIHVKRHKVALFSCRKCGQCYLKPEKLAKHMKNCKLQG